MPTAARVRLAILLPTVAAFAAASDVPYDVRAADDSRTHIAHVSAHAGGGDGGQTSVATSNTTVRFAGPAYGTPTAGSILSPTGRTPQAEEHIASSPADARTLVAAISDFSANRSGFSGYNTTMYAVSVAGGAWVPSWVPMVASGSQTLLATSDGNRWEYNSDPVVAFDRDGTAYIANLYLNDSNAANGIYLSVLPLDAAGRTATQATQTLRVVVNSLPTVSYAEDKEWIAVDQRTAAGTIYVVWTRFIGNSDQIMITSSRDRGLTWTPPAQVSPAAQNGAVQGPQVAVGLNGDVYVAWHVAYVGSRGAIFLAKSAAGGASFSTPVAITPMFNELTFNSTYRKNSFPALAVARGSGTPAVDTIHLLYADQPSKTLGAEIEYCRSTDGGLSFSGPLTLNDRSIGQQFMPAIAADANGSVHASWFDTRNSSSTSRYDIYATRSLDGGSTFAANTRVTGTTINASNASFIGDYAGICAGAVDGAGVSTGHPVWTSGGFSGGTLQTTTLGTR